MCAHECNNDLVIASSLYCVVRVELSTQAKNIYMAKKKKAKKAKKKGGKKKHR